MEFGVVGLGNLSAFFSAVADFEVLFIFISAFSLWLRLLCGVDRLRLCLADKIIFGSVELFHQLFQIHVLNRFV